MFALPHPVCPARRAAPRLALRHKSVSLDTWDSEQDTRGWGDTEDTRDTRDSRDFQDTWDGWGTWDAREAWDTRTCDPGHHHRQYCTVDV